MPKRTVSDLETGELVVGESDQCRWSSGPRRLYCNDMEKKTGELVCGGNNFAFNTFCTFSQCINLRIWSRAATTARATAFCILDVLKAI